MIRFSLTTSALKFRWLFLGLVILGVGLGLWLAHLKQIAETPPPEIQIFEGRAQGTEYHMSYVGPLDPGLSEEVTSFLADFDTIFSNYRADSEISRFNASQSTDWFPVDPRLAALLHRAKGFSEQSQGLFDVTIGALVKAWGFGAYKRNPPRIPSEQEIAAAMALVGHQHLTVQLQPPAIKKDIPGLLIDLSGIAQGYAVDLVADLFERRNHSSYLIEIGGETFTKGRKAPGQDWTLAIESPRAEPGTYAQLIHPKGLALATSGDYRNYFEKDGKRYSHLLDPRTGRPITHKLASVSVLAKDCTTADAMTKPFMVLGPEQGQKLAEQLKMPIYLIIKGEKDFEEKSAAGFDKYIVTD